MVLLFPQSGRNLNSALLNDFAGKKHLCFTGQMALYFFCTKKLKSCFQRMVSVSCPAGCFLLYASRAWARVTISSEVCFQIVHPPGRKQALLSKASFGRRGRGGIWHLIYWSLIWLSSNYINFILCKCVAFTVQHYSVLLFPYQRWDLKHLIVKYVQTHLVGPCLVRSFLVH